ncbi:MAG: TolC family protein [Acidobacteriaceae bacterium]|nr:TolC family protein [Acidobacteriaceae bacterium]
MMSTRTQARLLQFVVALVVTGAPAFAQESSLPELTLDEAIQQALAKNSSLKTATLDTLRAADDLAANKTKRFANTQVNAIGGQLLTKPSVTFEKGSLGVYPATGPIPATNQTINIARKPAGMLFASISQPLSTEYRIHLQLKALSLGLQATRQDQEKTRLEIIDQVRRAYYAVVQAQSAFESLEASLPFYKESKRLASESLKRETVLESDLLGADAQLLKTQNAVSDSKDQVASASERLNDLMGRDIHTVFRVAALDAADAELDAPAALEAHALQNRPELKKAKLQVDQAYYDARAKKAEYIPDVSLAFNYYTTANLQNALPSNIAVAGLQLSWEPWDWGRRRYEWAEKRVKEEQAKVAVNATERAVLLEVRNAWRQLENTRRQLQLSDATERAARQKLKETQEQVRREAVLTKVLFRAQSDLTSADSEHQEALAAFWKARADLKKAMGEQ